MKDEWGLRCYFNALGGIDVDKYDSDEDAVDDLAVQTENELWHAREEFLWESLSGCGWMGERTKVQINIPLMSTAYLYWWASNPRAIVEKFRAKLQSVLLEANSTQ
jgi:hypothetical protein